MKFEKIVKNDGKIAEIKLSRHFSTVEEFKALENKGFSVSWMEENIEKEKETFNIIIPEEYENQMKLIFREVKCERENL